MNSTIKYLELLKEKYNLKNQNQIAIFLKVRPSRIGNYYQETRHFDTYMTSRVCDLLNLNFKNVIAEIQKDAAKSEEEKVYWNSHLKAVGMSILLAGTVTISAELATLPDTELKNLITAECILC